MTTFPVPRNGADHVLVASPNSVVRQRLLDSLRLRTNRVELAAGGAEALVHLEKGSWQTLFLDRRLPDLDALELSETVRQRFPAVEVVLLDDEGEAQAGPAETQAKLDQTWLGTENDAEHANGDKKNHAGYIGRIEGGNIEAQSENCEGMASATALPGMVGCSATLEPVYRIVRLVAPRDTAVLITGPTGSGKELVARALHRLSRRSGRTFAVVNCAAIPETLLEAELFGYSRGAFTGAQQSYAGRIQAAHLGTLFLDEIGDMPLSLQPKLLRFLEQKELQRLGSSQVVRVDARVVSATNSNLPALVRAGKFREDLYYRLAAFPLTIPPLRERPEDIQPLAEHFLRKFSTGSPSPILSNEALALLQAESWPGNIRELQNVIERALILAAGQPLIRPEHLMLSNADLRARASSDRTPSSGLAMRAF